MGALQLASSLNRTHRQKKGKFSLSSWSWASFLLLPLDVSAPGSLNFGLWDLHQKSSKFSALGCQLIITSLVSSILSPLSLGYSMSDRWPICDFSTSIISWTNCLKHSWLSIIYHLSINLYLSVYLSIYLSIIYLSIFLFIFKSYWFWLSREPWLIHKVKMNSIPTFLEIMSNGRD
jgi:hypothetical protein